MQQAALFRRERQVGVSVFWSLSVIISERHFGGLYRLIEYSCVNILPQITQITQRNAASSIISQRKTGCWGVRLFCCCLGVCLRKSARSAGDFWGFICANRLSTLM